jgi:molecular chaperone HscB
MDPFAILGIPRSYEVDLPAVERTHRELSRALHPDRFVGASPSERKAALGKAVEVNEAWRVVRDPIRRAEALMRLAGVEVGEDKEPKPDAELLMEMLEMREALAEAKAERDLVRVRAMAKTIEDRRHAVQIELAGGFARGEAAALVGKLGELRFYRRFLDEVSAIEDELAA